MTLGYRHSSRWTRVHLVRVAVLAALIAPGVVLAGATGASATPCSGTYGSRFDGYERNPTVAGEQWEGVQATVTIQGGGICTGAGGGPGNFYTAWVMLASQDGKEYAQVGFMKYPGDASATHFSEWQSGTGSYHRTKMINVPNGHQNKYWVQYLPSQHQLSLNVDSDPFDVAPFDPNNTYAQPWRPIWCGEVKYLQSSMPGIPSAKVSFTPIQVQRVDNNSYQNIATSTLSQESNANPGSWKQALPNSSTVQIWSQ